jgi:hypothetical protein
MALAGSQMIVDGLLAIWLYRAASTANPPDFPATHGGSRAAVAHGVLAPLCRSCMSAITVSIGGMADQPRSLDPLPVTGSPAATQRWMSSSARARKFSSEQDRGGDSRAVASAQWVEAGEPKPHPQRLVGVTSALSHLAQRGVVRVIVLPRLVKE